MGLNAAPWKILKAKSPITKPGSRWFNAVTRVLSTIGIEFADGPIAQIMRPNASGENWKIIIPKPGSGPESNHRWRVRVADKEARTVYINDGAWERNGTRLVHASGRYEDPKVADFTFPETAGAYYLYATLDNPLTPAALTFDASAPATAETHHFANIRRLLAIVTIDGEEIKSFKQVAWQDFEDTVAIPDTNVGVHPTQATLEYREDKTLQIRGAGGAAHGHAVFAQTQLYGNEVVWDWPCAGLSNLGERVPSRRELYIENSLYGANNPGSGVTVAISHSARPALIENGRLTVDYEFEELPDITADCAVDAEVLAGNINGSIAHTALDFTASTAGQAGQNADHDDRYWVQGADESSCFGSAIGRGSEAGAGGTKVIDLENRELVDGGWAVTAGDLWGYENIKLGKDGTDPQWIFDRGTAGTLKVTDGDAVSCLEISDAVLNLPAAAHVLKVNGTQVLGPQQTGPAYTADDESAEYTAAADGEAKLSDLNALREAYENLRAMCESLLALTGTAGHGLHDA